MTRTPANLSRVVWLKSSPRNCADSSPFSLSLGDRIQAKSDGQIWKKKFKVWNFQNIIMALWDEVLGPLGTLWTHFWAPGGPGKLLGVSETGILEEFHFWLRKALKWTYVNESMKCYTISESSGHVLFRFIRFKLDFLHFLGARSLRRTKIRKSTTSTRSWKRHFI